MFRLEKANVVLEFSTLRANVQMHINHLGRYYLESIIRNHLGKLHIAVQILGKTKKTIPFDVSLSKQNLKDVIEALQIGIISDHIPLLGVKSCRQIKSTMWNHNIVTLKKA